MTRGRSMCVTSSTPLDRMRAMILGLLNLSRAGKVIGDLRWWIWKSWLRSSRRIWESGSERRAASCASSGRCRVSGAIEIELGNYWSI